MRNAGYISKYRCNERMEAWALDMYTFMRLQRSDQAKPGPHPFATFTRHLRHMCQALTCTHLQAVVMLVHTTARNVEALLQVSWEGVYLCLCSCLCPCHCNLWLVTEQVGRLRVTQILDQALRVGIILLPFVYGRSRKYAVRCRIGANVNHSAHHEQHA
jgi:hypothetical protein